MAGPQSVYAPFCMTVPPSEHTGFARSPVPGGFGSPSLPTTSSSLTTPGGPWVPFGNCGQANAQSTGCSSAHSQFGAGREDFDVTRKYLDVAVDAVVSESTFLLLQNDLSAECHTKLHTVNLAASALAALANSTDWRTMVLQLNSHSSILRGQKKLFCCFRGSHCYWLACKMEMAVNCLFRRFGLCGCRRTPPRFLLLIDGRLQINAGVWGPSGVICPLWAWAVIDKRPSINSKDRGRRARGAVLFFLAKDCFAM